MAGVKALPLLFLRGSDCECPPSPGCEREAEVGGVALGGGK